jgi:hypothetical protein
MKQKGERFRPQVQMREVRLTVERLLFLSVAPGDAVPAPRVSRAALNPVVVHRGVDVVQNVEVLVLVEPKLCMR